MNGIPGLAVGVDTKRSCNKRDEMEAVGWILRNSSRS